MALHRLPYLQVIVFHRGYRLHIDYGVLVPSPDAEQYKCIRTRYEDDMDIESHSMTHPHLSNLSRARLTYEIDGSKQ